MYIKKTKFENIRFSIPKWAEYVCIRKNGDIMGSATLPVFNETKTDWMSDRMEKIGEVPNKVHFDWKNSRTASCWIREGSVL